jgi:hypothetical protein
MMMHPRRWSHEGRFGAYTLDVTHYMEDVGPLMMRIDLLHDFACLWTPSSTSWIFDIVMIS